MRLTTRLRNATSALLGRSYEAAGSGSRWPAIATMAQPARQALASRSVIANRSAWLIANSPLGESIGSSWCVHLVGDGPSVRSRHPSADVRRRLEDGWNNNLWGMCDIESGDLVQLLNKVVRGTVTSGEAFVRMLVTRDGQLRLQLLNSEQCDASVNADLGNGRRIAAGVEVDRVGRRLAYHIRGDLDL